jgi:hypothetical protein
MITFFNLQDGGILHMADKAVYSNFKYGGIFKITRWLHFLICKLAAF